MIAIDTNVFIDYLQGGANVLTNKIEQLLKTNNAIFPPIVITELLSDHTLPEEVIINISALPTLSLRNGYWLRAGRNRAIILSKKFKARLADTLIAQICIDHDIPLLTRDNDFKHFAKYCGLKLLSVNC